MKLLITGASGFAGNVLLDLLPRKLPKAEISLFLLPNDPGIARIREKGIAGITFIRGDICDGAAVDRAVAGHSHVIHMAGLISYWKREGESLDNINRQGVANVVNACLRRGVRRLVHVSSVGAIGFRRDARLAEEETAYNWPQDLPYMTSKHSGQQIVEQAVREQGLPAIILNPASLMGPGDPVVSTPHNQLYQRIYRKGLFGCFGGGLAIADARDLAEIVIKALLGGEVGQKYLVVGANVTYRTVVRAIGRCYGRRVYPFPIPALVLTVAGGALELISAVTGKRPLLTRAYGRLSGWYAYYANGKSRRAFDHVYRRFDATIADGCRYFREHFG